MTKFVCTTQICRMNSYTGPSGEKYVSILKRPFVVTNADDIEYFTKNKRFRKLGLKEKLTGKKPQVEKESEADKLSGFLASIKGVSKKVISELVKIYDTLDNLKGDVEQDVDIATKYNLSKRQIKKIKEKIKPY